VTTLSFEVSMVFSLRGVPVGVVRQEIMQYLELKWSHSELYSLSTEPYSLNMEPYRLNMEQL